MVSDKTIDEIIEKNGYPFISITLPTHKTGEEIKQDSIRFKNLISQSIEQLTDRGMKKTEAEELLKPASELLSRPRFWTHQDHGLVVYIASGYFKYFRLPYPVEEKAYVNTHFLVTPLLPMVSMDGRFNVLAVSRSNVRLFRCTRNGATDITPADAPKSVDEYLEEAQEKQLQFHTGATNGYAMYFGHGANEESKQVVVEYYFRELEKEITKTVKKQNDPLVLVGLEDNLSFYKDINKYKRTLEQTVDANPDDLQDHDLKSKGWDIIQKYFLRDMYRSLEQFSEKNNEQVSNNLSNIVESTVMGKSKTIFITKDEERWGRYDEQNHEVHLTSTPSNGDVDMLNWLAVKGRETGSNVYLLPKDQMPMKSTVAAEFRF